MGLRRLTRWPSPTSQSRQWSPSYALVALATGWGMSAVLVLALRVVGIPIPASIAPLAFEVVLMASLFPLYRNGALRPVDLGLRRAPGPRSVMYATTALIAYVVGARMWAAFVHVGVGRGEFSALGDQGTAVIVLAGIVAVVGAPIAEEIFFRGFLYRSLRNRMGIAPACVTSAILFSIGHVQYPVAALPELFLFGVIMALLYERTGSLLPGIAVHAFVDASAFEEALTGNNAAVLALFVLGAIVILMRPVLRAVERGITGKPIFVEANGNR